MFLNRWLGVPLIAAALAFGSASTAYAGNSFGRENLVTPCCGGAALQGVRSSITQPSSEIVPNGEFALSSVASQQYASGTGYFLQAAVVYNNGLTIDNSTCTETGLFYFAETSDGTTATCYFIGYASSYSSAVHKYSLLKDSSTSNNWTVYFDGVLPGGRTISEPIGNAQLISGGGEIAYCSICDPSGVTWVSTFAGSGNTPFQRYNFSTGWYTVQSFNNTNFNSGWSADLTNFPTSWTVSHP